MSVECFMCGRTLTDPVSIRQGVGPECAGRYSAQSSTIAAVRATVAAGNFEHFALTRAFTLLNAAESRAETDPKARREVLKQWRIIANWASKIEGMYGIALTTPALRGNDPAERPEDDEAARPVLTEAQQLEADGFSAWCADLARTQAPLDGCEDEPVAPRASLAGWYQAAVAA